MASGQRKRQGLLAGFSVEDPDVKCTFCNKGVGKEILIGCEDCGKSTHPSCQELPVKMLEIIQTYSWQCGSCKQCIICHGRGNEELMLLCDHCDRGYHRYCLHSKEDIKETDEGDWICPVCKIPEPPVTVINDDVPDIVTPKGHPKCPFQNASREGPAGRRDSLKSPRKTPAKRTLDFDMSSKSSLRRKMRARSPQDLTGNSKPIESVKALPQPQKEIRTVASIGTKSKILPSRRSLRRSTSTDALEDKTGSHEGSEKMGKIPDLKADFASNSSPSRKKKSETSNPLAKDRVGSISESSLNNSASLKTMSNTTTVSSDETRNLEMNISSNKDETQKRTSRRTSVSSEEKSDSKTELDSGTRFGRRKVTRCSLSPHVLENKPDEKGTDDKKENENGIGSQDDLSDQGIRSPGTSHQTPSKNAKVSEKKEAVARTTPPRGNKKGKGTELPTEEKNNAFKSPRLSQSISNARKLTQEDRDEQNHSSLQEDSRVKACAPFGRRPSKTRMNNQTSSENDSTTTGTESLYDDTATSTEEENDVNVSFIWVENEVCIPATSPVIRKRGQPSKSQTDSEDNSPVKTGKFRRTYSFDNLPPKPVKTRGTDCKSEVKSAEVKFNDFDDILNVKRPPIKRTYSKDSSPSKTAKVGKLITCPVKGCDGAGNVDPRYISHHTMLGCPKTNFKRRKRTSNVLIEELREFTTDDSDLPSESKASESELGITDSETDTDKRRKCYPKRKRKFLPEAALYGPTSDITTSIDAVIPVRATTPKDFQKDTKKESKEEGKKEWPKKLEKIAKGKTKKDVKKEIVKIAKQRQSKEQITKINKRPSKFQAGIVSTPKQKQKLKENKHQSCSPLKIRKLKHEKAREGPVSKDERNSKPHRFVDSKRKSNTGPEETQKQKILRKPSSPANSREEENEFDIKSIITPMDIALFEGAKRNAQENLEPETDDVDDSCIRTIDFGSYVIDTWYVSPYPREYSKLRKLYVCEFCLKYMKSSTILRRHMAKCVIQHPPGDEVYREGQISVFEVDGERSKTYCQNLCLLAKLFLDHKTLYYEVGPFLFYVMTEADEKGCHLIGYFSKEKSSFLNYNVACILVMPHYMKKGYGRWLIDFSYLLSQKENKIGTPEHPLSDLGLISYRKYWTDVVLQYLSDFHETSISIKEISQKTSIHPNDIVSTLQSLGMVKYWKGKHLVFSRKDLIDEHMKKYETRKKTRNDVDPSLLHWVPKTFIQENSKGKSK